VREMSRSTSTLRNKDDLSTPSSGSPPMPTAASCPARCASSR
jgi:hypothetical protein